MCAVNGGRYWMMDEVDCRAATSWTSTASG